VQWEYARKRPFLLAFEFPVMTFPVVRAGFGGIVRYKESIRHKLLKVYEVGKIGF